MDPDIVSTVGELAVTVEVKVVAPVHVSEETSDDVGELKDAGFDDSGLDDAELEGVELEGEQIL